VKLVDVALLFYAVSVAFFLVGGMLLGHCVVSLLTLHAVDALPLAASAAFFASSALSYALYRRYYRKAVEERAKECLVKQYSEIIEEIRRLREELEKGA